MLKGKILLGVSLIVSSLVTTGAPALAKPVDITVKWINGIQVYFLNNHVGNQYTMGVYVPTGTGHDEPIRMAGLAHLWEHVIHRGSVPFPDGEKMFKKMDSQIGGRGNAYTTTDHTFYHWTFQQEALNEVAEYLGALVFQPLFNPTDFEAEKKVVIDEANQYLGRDTDAIFSGMSLENLPPEHPLSKHSVGVQSQLEPMTIDDLKALYAANYRPPYLKAVITGNLDDSEFRARVEAEIQKYFVVRPLSGVPVAESSAKMKIPDVVPETGARKMHEFEGKSGERTLYLRFQGDHEWVLSHPGAVESLSDFLRSQFKGSFFDFLQHQGWVTATTVSSMELNHVQFTDVEFTLTEEGANRRKEILDLFFGALHQLQQKGLPEELVSFLRRRNIASYSLMYRAPNYLARHFARELGNRPALPIDALDPELRFGSVTGQEIVEAVDRVLPKDRYLVGYIGPDVVGDPGKTSKLYGLPLRTLDAPVVDGSRVTMPADFTRVTIPPILSEFPATVTTVLAGGNASVSKPKVIRSSVPGAKIILEEDHRSPWTGAAALFRLPITDVEKRAGIRVWGDAFLLHYQGEMEALMAENLLRSVAIGKEIGIITEGDRVQSQELLLKIVKDLANFRPTSEELSRSREKVAIDLRSAIANNFTARIAIERGSAELDPKNPDSEAELRAVEQLDLSKIEGPNPFLRSADITLALSGDVSRQIAIEIVEKMRAMGIEPLSSEVKASLARIPGIEHGVSERVVDSPVGHPDEAVGHVRFYNGPDPRSIDHGVMEIAMSAIGGSIFQLNRARKGLGYVHGAGQLTRASLQKSFLALYGQTAYPGREKEIPEGWKEVLRSLARFEIPVEDFESAKLGWLRGHKVIATTPAARAEELVEQTLVYGSPANYQRIVEGVTRFDGEQIRRTARWYLTAPRRSRLDVVMKRLEAPNCEKVLVGE